MSSRFLVLLVLGLVVLAGCSGKSARVTSASSTTFTSSTTSTTTNPNTGNGTQTPPPSNKVVFDQCTAWSANDSNGFGPVMPPGKVPPGWEPGPTDVGALGARGIDCKRVSVGTFERPARLVWEENAHVAIPAGCVVRGQGGSDWGILNSLYLEDPELAAYLNHTYGMPVQLSKITNQTQDTGAVKLHTVSWGPVGMDPSSVTIEEDTSVPPDLTSNLALFWQKGSGIGVVRAQIDSVAPAVGDRNAYGTIKPPMQMSGFLGGNFAGTGDWFSSYHAEGSFTLYGDWQCKTPG